MRRWYIGCGAVAVLSVVAAVWLSRGQAQEAKNAEKPQASKIAKSRIDKVTVYTTNALITREVEVPEGNGLIELVVSPMPAQVVPSTIYSEGGNGLRVLTTRFSTRQVFEDTSAERRKREAEIDKYQVLGAKIASEMASLQKNMALLVKLEQVTEKGKHTGDEVIAMAKYVMEQRVEKSKEMVALQDQKRLNDIQMSFIQRKMGELGGSGGKVEREAVIVVDRTAGAGGTIRLNYLVGAVAWRPEYKVRAGKANEDVKLDYLANLMQHSGEDWNRVTMTLSTAQPLLNASPPELGMLQPLLVMRGAPGAPPMPAGGPTPFAQRVPSMELQNLSKALRDKAGMNYRSGKAKDQEAAQKQLNDAAAWEQNLELMQSRREVLDNLKNSNKANLGPAGSDGPSITYHLPAKLTVPSRNDEQVIEVVKLKLAPKYYYKTVPVLNTRVYRLADLVNKSDHVLLPGEATMYQGSDFVGRMPMPLVAVGEEFTAGFGVDTQLQVQRQMVDQTRTTAGGNQVLKYDYRILISSFKKDPVQLQVWDRLPKGETESVGVILVKASPELSKDGLYLRESRPNNLLRWDVTVPANCSGEKAFGITYEFRMELDRQMAITGFQSK
ncbi:MAG: DUF4139 domain-containing protein [Planctomycetes bacterium]|nr:DUF4139 domain-containing protein [Planctomycetota bacterium]